MIKTIKTEKTTQTDNLNETENWLDKYRPTKLSEVLGDKIQIQRIESFLKQFTKKKININRIHNPNLIITGRNGIGKTLIVDLAIKENGLEKVIVDLSTISAPRKTKKKKLTEKEAINSNRMVKTYYMAQQNNKYILSTGEYGEKKIVLVFDDVSNISNPKEKEIIKSIVKLNNKFKKIPIIIIANTKHCKMVTELKKMATYKIDTKKIVNEIFMKPPQYNEIETFINKICAKEKLSLVQDRLADDDLYVNIVEHSQFDIRRLIHILEELKMMYEDLNVTFEDFEQYCDTAKTKYLDPGIYEATRMLLNRYSNMSDALLLYSEERATIPLMVHENYPLNIRVQYPRKTIDDQLNMIYDISKSISESDKVDGLIYSNQCWSLQSVHGFYSCVMPSYYVNQLPGKNQNAEKHLYKYTQDYNKTSIKKINNKVIKKAQENQVLKKVSIYDFLHIAFILKVLFERKDFVTVVDLMKPYELKLKEIVSIIKIDKIKKIKNTLTGKQCTILKEMLGVKE